MKTLFISPLTSLAAAAVVSAAAQDAALPLATPEPLGPITSTAGYSVAETGPHHRVWQQLAQGTNDNGAVSLQRCSYVELATAMSHWADGRWTPSSREFVITDSCARATNCQHQIELAGNLNTASGSVTLTTPDGKQLVSKVLGLSYFDNATGASLWVAETKDAYGELLPSRNEALYPDAFSGCRGSVLYLNEVSRFEQLIILEQQLPSCADWGMDPASTWLCVITEFMDPPQPEVQPVEIDGAADTRLDFGIMQMVHGEAFAIGSETNRVPVIKRWLLLDGRQCLVELAPLSTIQPMLADLPPATASIGSPADPFLHKLLAGAKPKPGSSQEPLSALALPPRHSSAAVKTPEPGHAGRAFKLASVRPGYKGLGLDYTFLTSQSTPFVFQGDTVLVPPGLTISSGRSPTKLTLSASARLTIIIPTAPPAPGN